KKKTLVVHVYGVGSTRKQATVEVGTTKLPPVLVRSAELEERRHEKEEVSLFCVVPPLNSNEDKSAINVVSAGIVALTFRFHRPAVVRLRTSSVASPAIQRHGQPIATQTETYFVCSPMARRDVKRGGICCEVHTTPSQAEKAAAAWVCECAQLTMGAQGNAVQARRKAVSPGQTGPPHPDTNRHSPQPMAVDIGYDESVASSGRFLMSFWVHIRFNMSADRYAGRRRTSDSLMHLDRHTYDDLTRLRDMWGDPVRFPVDHLAPQDRVKVNGKGDGRTQRKMALTKYCV
ncbi:hypothetical protein BIW11_05045, partial [Tropilaelaps mercedesae]